MSPNCDYGLEFTADYEGDVTSAEKLFHLSPLCPAKADWDVVEQLRAKGAVGSDEGWIVISEVHHAK